MPVLNVRHEQGKKRILLVVGPDYRLQSHHNLQFSLMTLHEYRKTESIENGPVNETASDFGQHQVDMKDCASSARLQ
jgi:hypothetical protein